MKKYLLATGLTLVAVPALADELSCANIPDTECADLGFVQDTTKCSGYPSLKCPFDAEQVYCGDVCYVGAILYSDGKCYERTQTNKEVVGVVFDMENRLAVSLNSDYMPWSKVTVDISGLENCSDSSTLTTTCGTDGKANTAAIVAQLGDTSDYAAGYCYNLTEGGKTAGSWWLPSVKELKTFYDNKKAVDVGLTAAGGIKVTTGGDSRYFSSVEYSSGAAWSVHNYNGYFYAAGKYANYSAYQVRCVTSF